MFNMNISHFRSCTTVFNIEILCSLTCSLKFNVLYYIKILFVLDKKKYKTNKDLLIFKSLSDEYK